MRPYKILGVGLLTLQGCAGYAFGSKPVETKIHPWHAQNIELSDVVQEELFAVSKPSEPLVLNPYMETEHNRGKRYTFEDSVTSLTAGFRR